MSIITEQIKDQVLTLVQQQKKAKIKWIARIVLLTEEQLIDLAPKLDLKIDGEYLVASKKMIEEAKSKNLSKEEYDQLNPKPAPTFCEAKASRNKY